MVSSGDEVIKIGITNDLDLYNLEGSLAQRRVTLVQILRNETKSLCCTVMRSKQSEWLT